MRRTPRLLEDISEPQGNDPSLISTEDDLGAHREVVHETEPKSEAVTVPETVEVEIGPAVRDLGRVIEQNTGQERIDVPAVFPLEQERMEIAQAIDAQAANGMRAAECRHQIKRNLIAFRGSSAGNMRAEHDRACARDDRDVLLEIEVPAVERVPLQIAI